MVRPDGTHSVTVRSSTPLPSPFITVSEFISQLQTNSLVPIIALSHNTQVIPPNPNNESLYSLYNLTYAADNCINISTPNSSVSSKVGDDAVMVGVIHDKVVLRCSR